MFELLAGQHKTKELQNFYNANQNLRNTPKELNELLKMMTACP